MNSSSTVIRSQFLDLDTILEKNEYYDLHTFLSEIKEKKADFGLNRENYSMLKKKLENIICAIFSDKDNKLYKTINNSFSYLDVFLTIFDKNEELKQKVRKLENREFNCSGKDKKLASTQYSTNKYEKINNELREEVLNLKKEISKRDTKIKSLEMDLSSTEEERDRVKELLKSKSESIKELEKSILELSDKNNTLEYSLNRMRDSNLSLRAQRCLPNAFMSLHQDGEDMTQKVFEDIIEDLMDYVKKYFDRIEHLEAVQTKLLQLIDKYKLAIDITLSKMEVKESFDIENFMNDLFLKIKNIDIDNREIQECLCDESVPVENRIINFCNDCCRLYNDINVNRSSSSNHGNELRHNELDVLSKTTFSLLNFISELANSKKLQTLSIEASFDEIDINKVLRASYTRVHDFLNQYGISLVSEVSFFDNLLPKIDPTTGSSNLASVLESISHDTEEERILYYYLCQSLVVNDNLRRIYIQLNDCYIKAKNNIKNNENELLILKGRIEELTTNNLVGESTASKIPEEIERLEINCVSDFDLPLIEVIEQNQNLIRSMVIQSSHLSVEPVKPDVHSTSELDTLRNQLDEYTTKDDEKSKMIHSLKTENESMEKKLGKQGEQIRKYKTLFRYFVKELDNLRLKMKHYISEQCKFILSSKDVITGLIGEFRKYFINQKYNSISKMESVVFNINGLNRDLSILRKNNETLRIEKDSIKAQLKVSNEALQQESLKSRTLEMKLKCLEDSKQNETAMRIRKSQLELRNKESELNQKLERTKNDYLHKMNSFYLDIIHTFKEYADLSVPATEDSIKDLLCRVSQYLKEVKSSNQSSQKNMEDLVNIKAMLSLSQDQKAAPIVNDFIRNQRNKSDEINKLKVDNNYLLKELSKSKTLRDQSNYVEQWMDWSTKICSIIFPHNRITEPNNMRKVIEDIIMSSKTDDFITRKIMKFREQKYLLTRYNLPLKRIINNTELRTKSTIIACISLFYLKRASGHSDDTFSFSYICRR